MAAGCEQEWRDFRILDGSFPIDKTASQERLLFHISGALVDNEPDVIPAQLPIADFLSGCARGPY